MQPSALPCTGHAGHPASTHRARAHQHLPGAESLRPHGPLASPPNTHHLWEICGKPGSVSVPAAPCPLWAVGPAHPPSSLPDELVQFSGSEHSPRRTEPECHLGTCPDPSTSLTHRPLTLRAQDLHCSSFSITLHGPFLS